MKLTLNKALLFAVILCLIVTLVSLKLGGASIIADPSMVEKDGFCKTIYGEGFNYHERDLHCYQEANMSNQKYFIEEDFRITCPKNNFLSSKFYSDCFHAGDSRS